MNLVDVLTELRGLLASPEADFSWQSSWTDSAEAVAEIDAIIDAVRSGEVPRERIRFIFLPTGPAQEVGISSGWGGRFLALAQECDRALAESRARRTGY